MKQVNRRFILAADRHSALELAHSRTEKQPFTAGTWPSLASSPLPCPAPAVGLQQQSAALAGSEGSLLGGQWSTTPVQSVTCGLSGQHTIKLVRSHHCPG